MNIKNIIAKTLLLVSFVSLAGCYDLNQYPGDTIPSGSFWKSEEEINQGVLGVYAAMKKDDAFAVHYTRDCLTDIGIGLNWGVYGFIEVALGTSSAIDGVYLSVWTRMYDGVARANTAIRNVNNTSVISDAQKAPYLAELRFLRAFFYNELLNLYGGVPLYDETTILEEEFATMLKPRSSEADTRKFILDDLEYAATNLPQKRDTNYGARVLQSAAYAMKGKVLLFNKQYTDAATAFEKVINGGYGHALYHSYADLFKPGGDESSEMIFAIQNLGGASTPYGMPVHYIANRASYGGCINCLVPSNELADMYEYKDGRPFSWDELFPGFSTDNAVKEKVFKCTFEEDGRFVKTYPQYKDQLLAMYKERDPRMDQTLLLPYTYQKSWVNNAKADCEFVLPCGNEVNGYVRNAFNRNTYLYKKFVPEYDMDGLIVDRFNSPTNFPLIRYADVLLMLAECYNKSNNQSGAVELINQVRARAGMPGLNSGPSYLAANTEAQVFERIKKERAIELAAEGIRFMDLKRWGLLVQLTHQHPQKDLLGQTIQTMVTPERATLWPIPLTEIDKNNKLTQNDGWK